MLKSFSAPGYLHSEDGVVWLWHLLVNLCIYIIYIFLQYFLLCRSCFQGKPMGAVSAFTTRNYPRQPVAVYLFVIFVNLFFMFEFKFDVIEDISSAKMSHSFAAVEILIKRTFFAFSPFFNFSHGKPRNIYIHKQINIYNKYI